MKRRIQENDADKKSSSTINLVYPFSLESDVLSNINPPMIRSPFVDDKGFLDIKLSSPIALINGSISLLTDNVFTSQNGKLTLLLTPPLVSSPTGVSISSSPPLAIAGDELTLNIDENCPLQISDEKLSLTNDTSLKVVDRSIGVNLAQNGCINSSPTGLSVALNNTQFNSVGNTINLNPISRTMSSGERNNFSALVFTNISQNGNRISLPCAYKYDLVSAFGIVYASISLKLTCSRVYDLIPSGNRNDVPSFTFWMCLDEQNDSNLNFSRCFNFTYSSSDVTSIVNSLKPSSSNVWIDNPTIITNGYMGSESGNYLFGKPNLIGNIENNYTSKLSITFMSSGSSQTKIPALTFTLEPSGGSSQVYFYTQNTGEVTFGPLYFSYTTF